MTTTKSNAAEMVFTMGLPAAGKSTIVRSRYSATHVVIDPDAVKETHPEYDPKNPAALHAWSKAITDRQFADALAAGAGLFVVDGTGTNAAKMIAKMCQAREAGFAVRLMYVVCTLETSLRRNAARARTVPADIVIEKSAQIQAAFAETAPHADSVETIANDDAANAA